jgi:AcrR family transcriptional regulator
MAAAEAETPQRAPLTHERILRAALEFADEHGVESLKMRDLGKALGFEAMALYRHVANKDDILDGIAGLVLSETEPPSPEGDWAEAIRRSAISVHEALSRHPWATSLLTSRRPRLDYMEALLARLEKAGFSAEWTYHAYHVLDAYIFGFSLWQAHHSLTVEEQQAVLAKVAEEISFDDYPSLARHRDQHLAPGPHHDVSAFEVGLDSILSGLREKLG